MMETTYALGSPPGVRNLIREFQMDPQLFLVVVYLAFLVVIVVIVSDNNELARFTVKGLIEMIQKTLTHKS